MSKRQSSWLVSTSTQASRATCHHTDTTCQPCCTWTNRSESHLLSCAEDCVSFWALHLRGKDNMQAELGSRGIEPSCSCLWPHILLPSYGIFLHSHHNAEIKLLFMKQRFLMGFCLSPACESSCQYLDGMGWDPLRPPPPRDWDAVSYQASSLCVSQWWPWLFKITPLHF